MKAGDLIIAYQGHENLRLLNLLPGDKLSNQYGNFHHNDIIGKPFGSKISLKSGKYIYALRPTPELYSRYKLIFSYI